MTHSLIRLFFILICIICSININCTDTTRDNQIGRKRKVSLLRNEYLRRLNIADLQDRYETEIDSREPRSFRENMYQYHWTRQDGFEYVSYIHNNNTEYLKVSWQRYSLDYWYETRVPNAICPQIPKGIAAMCDWAIMVPCLFGDVTKEPRTVFVHTDFIHHLFESTFRFINPDWRFVLVSSGSDESIPRGTLDVRFRLQRGFSRDGGVGFQQLLNSPNIIHWFIENRDYDHPKLSSLPTGMPPDVALDIPKEVIPLKNRPLLFLNADRIRDGGGQWYDRWNASQMCKTNHFCSQPFNGINAELGVQHKDFVDHLVNVPFLMCVHGGGEDPSPKAFEAMLMGTIPIIKKGYITDAYERFPVAWIDDWPSFLSDPLIEEKLEKWVNDLGSYYDANSELRAKVLKMLTSEYWYSQIEKKYIEYQENINQNKTMK